MRIYATFTTKALSDAGRKVVSEGNVFKLRIIFRITGPEIEVSPS
jgi:hypothetical protein